MAEAIQVGTQTNAQPPPGATQQTEFVTGPFLPQTQNNESAATEFVTTDNYFGSSDAMLGSASENSNDPVSYVVDSVGNAASFVINGVEKFLNPEKTQSLSLAEMAAKGENASPWESIILKSQGYELKPMTQVTREVTGYTWETYNPNDSTQVYRSDYMSGRNFRIPTYQEKTVISGYKWELTGTPQAASISALSLVADTVATPFRTAYEAGYNFGKNTLKPAGETAWKALNTEAITYIPPPTMPETIDTSGETLFRAQAEGIPVTYNNGVFTINAQGADYDVYSARINQIQLDVFNEKKSILEADYNTQKKKRDASIFGTGISWSDDVNAAFDSILPDSWTPKKEIVAYGESDKFGAPVVKGLSDAYGKWYNDKVSKYGANALTEIAGEVAIGEAVGAAVKGGTIILRTGAEAGASVLSAGVKAVGPGITGKVLSVGSKALSLGSTVEEASVTGKVLNAVVNASGKVAAGTDTAADVLIFGANKLSVGSRYIEPVTNTILMGQVVSDIADSESYAEGWGKVGSLAVGGLGYSKGAKAAVKAYDAVRTRGMSEIPISDIVDAKVLSGENRLPMIEKGKTSENVIEMFKTEEGVSKGYHATPAEFKETTETSLTQGRKTDMPGLYVSPEQSGPSVHFTRVGKDGSPYTSFISGVTEASKGVKLTVKGLVKASNEYLNEKTVNENQASIDAGLKTASKGIDKVKSGTGQAVTAIVGSSEPLKPAILHVELTKGVERLPEESRYNVPHDKEVKGKIIFENSPSRQFFQANKGTERTFLTPVLERSLKGGAEAEAEAVISPGTKLVKTGSEGYINFSGRRIPVLSYVTEATKDVTKSDIGETGISKGSKSFNAKDIKAEYSYGAIENKGILSDVGYVSPMKRGYPGSNSYDDAQYSAISSVESSVIPSVSNLSSLNSRAGETNSRSVTMPAELNSVYSELETGSSLPGYPQMRPEAASSLTPESRNPNSIVSKISGVSSSRSFDMQGRVVSDRSDIIDLSSVTPSSITPSSIISGISPVSPVPSVIRSDSSDIIDLSPVPPSSITPSSIISGITPISPVPSVIRGDVSRTWSYRSLPGPEPIIRIDRFGKDKNNEPRKKTFELSTNSGILKRGHLKNKFGDIDIFAKKAASGDKIKIKKIKLR